MVARKQAGREAAEQPADKAEGGAAADITAAVAGPRADRERAGRL